MVVQKTVSECKWRITKETVLYSCDDPILAISLPGRCAARPAA